MAIIQSVKAVEILDSRGNPTLQVNLALSNGQSVFSSVPSGASTGENEALELRDCEPKRYRGKGVKKAINNVIGPINDLLVGECVFDQRKLDLLLIENDGTVSKKKFGANAILGTSMAIARAGALASGLPLYQYIGGVNAHILPCPMMNIINGGAHADNIIDFQEFMIRPKGATTFAEALRWGVEVFHTLKEILFHQGHVTSVGDEGGFAPNLISNESTLDLIIEAIKKAGYRPGEQISIALDCAASEFYDKKSRFYTEKKKKLRKQPYEERTYQEQTKYLKSLMNKYPIDSIEDPLAENDWKGWEYLSKELNSKVQIVGDDLFVTNPKFLMKGIKLGIGNSILIKLNQIGTLTETLDTIHMARTYGYSTIISHRSGETEDSFIADLAVAMNTGQIKTGSLSRSDRISKYNRLLTIESELSNRAVYRDSNLQDFFRNSL